MFLRYIRKAFKHFISMQIINTIDFKHFICARVCVQMQPQLTVDSLRATNLNKCLCDSREKEITQTKLNSRTRDGILCLY